MASIGFFLVNLVTSIFKANTTSGSLFKLFGWSLSLYGVHLLTVLESEEAFTQSSIESLDDSLISVNVHIPSSYPHIMLCHLSCDFTHEFTSRIKHKNFQPPQLPTLIDCLKSLRDLRRIIWSERFGSLESACNIKNCQCILADFLTSRGPVMRKEKKIGLMNYIWDSTLKVSLGICFGASK